MLPCCVRWSLILAHLPVMSLRWLIWFHLIRSKVLNYVLPLTWKCLLPWSDVGKKDTDWKLVFKKLSFYFFHSFLYAQGDYIFQQWKKRFFALVYHHKYLLCCYAVNGTNPKKILPLEGYTVDYSEATSITQGTVLCLCIWSTSFIVLWTRPFSLSYLGGKIVKIKKY